LAALNPRISPSERPLLKKKLMEYHVAVIEKIMVKSLECLIFYVQFTLCKYRQINQATTYLALLKMRQEETESLLTLKFLLDLNRQSRLVL